MPSHLAFFAQDDVQYVKVMAKHNGRTLVVSLGTISDFGTYEKFVLMVSKFVPAQYFLLEPMPVDDFGFDTILTAAGDAGILD
jgi:hypothetical protein